MRVKAITPIRVDESELERRRTRYQALSPPSVEVELVNLPYRRGVPRSLDSAQAIRASEELVVEEALRTDPGRHDAVLPDCVLDPGLEHLEREGPVAAFGILKLSSGFLVSLGHRFAAFTRNHPIGDELHARLESYGYLPFFDRVAVLNLAFGDIADDEGWNEALKEATADFSGKLTTAIINGCSAVEIRQGTDVSVTLVDPTRLALSLLGLAASAGLERAPRAARSVGIG